MRTFRDIRQGADLAQRLHVDQNAGRHRARQFIDALPRPRKADALRIRAGVERDGQFAARGDVESIGQAGHVADERRHRIGLDRVVNLHGFWQ